MRQIDLQARGPVRGRLQFSMSPGVSQQMTLAHDERCSRRGSPVPVCASIRRRPSRRSRRAPRFLLTNCSCREYRFETSFGELSPWPAAERHGVKPGERSAALTASALRRETSAPAFHALGNGVCHGLGVAGAAPVTITAAFFITESSFPAHHTATASSAIPQPASYRSQ